MRVKEFEPRKLVIFDIDDTLVHTQTKVHVVSNGQVTKSLNSHDFTHYKLQPGEEFNFGDFASAQEFFSNAKPIIPMLNQLKHDIATGNKVVMVTARADFDDKELFLDTFRKYGIDMNKVHVYRAGNMSGKIQTEEKKKIIIRNLLDKDNYSKAIMYDDAIPNLESFVSLKEEYPDTKFYAWHVSLKGKASEYHRTNENFADGRNPRDKGDSKRYHVPTKASVSTLRKVAKQGGRKGQLAHWLANMKAGKKKHESVGDTDDYEIHNYQKLDRILSKLCDMVTKGQTSKQDFGMVAAAVLDPDNQMVARLNRPGKSNKRIHAEHAAIEDYMAKYGAIPEGSIIITTLSPCNEHMDERDGPSCTAIINQCGVKKVYCGYMDPTQDDDTRTFNVMETVDKSIRDKCKQFADTFLDNVKENMLPNSVFAGSSVGQKAGVPGQLRGNAKQRKDGKQPAFNKLVGGS
jgi:pyrimidine deaminase RibD-like protein